MYRGLKKVISGGQTGADQAGLMAAFKMGIKTGGTAPDGWYTENGANPLLELLGLDAAGDYRSRTIKNVTNSTGTVLITNSPNSPGSKLTRNEATRQGKPFYQITTDVMHNRLAAGLDIKALVLAASAELQLFIVEHKIECLNVAGNREKTKTLDTTKLVEAICKDAFHALDMSDLIIRDTDLF